MTRDDKIKELNKDLKEARDAVTAENKLAFSPNILRLRDIVQKISEKLEYIKSSIYKS